MRRFLSSTVVACALVLCVVFALTGCTPTQMRAFVAWHETDPAGAEQWLSSSNVA